MAYRRRARTNFAFPRVDITVQRTNDRTRDFTITSIRNHVADEHPRGLFVRVLKQGTALDLAKGARFALDVESGATTVAANIERR